MIKAVIFDMDGVILDSIPMHFGIWKKIFEKRNINFTIKDFEKYNGTSTPEIITETIRDFNLKDTPDEIEKEKRLLEEHEKDNMLKLFDDAVPLLLRMRVEGYSVALATSSARHMLDYVLTRFDLEKYFDAVVCADEVLYTKPAPDLFLLAAKKLDVQPCDCVVIEDAENGLIAAKRAGMAAVGISTTSKKDELKEADFIISKLSDIDMQRLEMVKVKCAE